MAKLQTLWAVLVINALFFILEVWLGMEFSSLGVAADGFDMLCDAVSYGAAIIALSACACYKKQLADIAGYTLALSGIAGFGMIVDRVFFGAETPDYIGMALISAAAFCGNALSLWLLRRLNSNDTNIRAVEICSSKDCLTNIGVILASLLIYLTKSVYPDLIVSAVVFYFVLNGARDIFELKENKCEEVGCSCVKCHRI